MTVPHTLSRGARRRAIQTIHATQTKPLGGRGAKQPHSHTAHRAKHCTRTHRTTTRTNLGKHVLAELRDDLRQPQAPDPGQRQPTIDEGGGARQERHVERHRLRHPGAQNLDGDVTTVAGTPEHNSRRGARAVSAGRGARCVGWAAGRSCGLLTSPHSTPPAPSAPLGAPGRRNRHREGGGPGVRGRY
jgi:hypothetical protein